MFTYFSTHFILFNNLLQWINSVTFFELQSIIKAALNWGREKVAFKNQSNIRKKFNKGNSDIRRKQQNMNLCSCTAQPAVSNGAVNQTQWQHSWLHNHQLCLNIASLKDQSQ